MIRSLAVCLVFSASLVAQTGSASQSNTAGQAEKPAEATSSAPAQIAPEKQALIDRIMEVAGTKAIMMQTMQAMEGNIRPLMTQALPPGDYRDKLIDLFFAKFHSKADSQKLMEMLVPVYDKYYSTEELKQLLQFYQTPIGKKSLEVMPKVLAESENAGRKWGETLGQDTMLEVLAEHPDLAKAAEAARRPPLPK